MTFNYLLSIDADVEAESRNIRGRHVEDPKTPEFQKKTKLEKGFSK
jgi:hypothetical protein